MKRARSTITRAASSTRKNARDAGRRDFADAVADDCGRFARPRISRAPRAPPASRKSPAAQSPSVASARSPRCDRVPREARNLPTAASPRRIAPSPGERPARARISSRPMPHHCGPWPLMTKPMRGGSSRRAAKVDADFRALLIARKRVEFLDDLGHVRGQKRQPVRMMIPMDAQGVGEIRQDRRTAIRVGVLRHPRRSVSRPNPEALPPSERKAPAATADRRAARQAFAGGCAGGAARMTCAFAPPNPNELTPAIRSPGPFGKRLQRGRHAQFQLLEIDVRTWRFEMEAAVESGRASGRASP